MGGSKKQTVGYRYFAGVHMVLCHGPIDNMSQITVDEKELWAGITAGQGGSASGWIRFNSQPVAIFNNVTVGATTFEFVDSGATGNQVNIGATVNQTAINLAAKITAMVGVTATASGNVVNLVSTIGNIALSLSSGFFGGLLGLFGGNNSMSISGSSLSGANGQLAINRPDLFGGDSREGGITGYLDFMSGAGGQTPNDYLVSRLGPLVPAFRGVVSIVLRQMYLSMNPYLKTWSFRVQRIHVQQDGSPQWEDAYSQINVDVYDATGAASTAAAMNPSHIIRECLTNKLWGMGYNEGDIDDVAFLAAAIVFFNEKMGMALLWDTQTSIEEFVKIILQHVDAALYVDRRTGKFTLKPIRGGYDEASLLVLDPSNIDKIDDFKRPAFGELANAITVNYWDYVKDQTATLTVQDIALSQEQGGDNATTVTYEGFIDAATASKVAQRDLRSLSTPLITCTIYATKVARNLNIGDVFVLSWPDYQIQSVVMRVTGVAYGDGKTRRVRIQCAQDVFSYPEDAFVSPPPSGWVDPSGPPGPVLFKTAFEVPYYELVRDNGQSVVDSSLASNPYVGYVGAACSTPLKPSINALMYSNDGSGYAEVGQTDFCAGAFLVADIERLETVFNILGGTSLSLVDAGEWLQIDGELMGVVSLVGNTLTVKRGVLDTLPELHSAGTQILFWDGINATDPTEYVASDIVEVRLTAANGSGLYPIELAEPMTVEIVGRAAKPFPPANVKLNDELFPALVGGDLIVSWTTRNRILQTGGELVGWFEPGAITPEAGMTFSCRVFNNETDVLISELLDTTDLTFTVLQALLITVNEARIEVFSTMETRVCFQPFVFVVTIDNGDIPINDMRDVGTLDELRTSWRVTGATRTPRTRGL